jgi:WD40 repeat protein
VVRFSRVGWLVAVIVTLSWLSPWPDAARPDERPEALRNPTDLHNDALGDPLPPRALARLGTQRLRLPLPVESFACSADGKVICASNSLGRARLWDAATGKELPFRLPQETATLVALFPDGKTVATARPSHRPYGDLSFWDLATGKESILPLSDDDRIMPRAIAVSPDSKSFALGGEQGLLVFNADDYSLRFRLPQLKYVSAILFSPDSKRLATGYGGAGLIHLWDTVKGTEVGRFELPLKDHQHMYSWAFSSDSKRLVTGSADKLIRFWDLGKKQEVGHLECEGYRLAYSPDGKSLATYDGSPRSVVQLWDIARAKEVRTIPTPVGGIDGLVFSPDGKTLLIGGGAHNLYLCDVATGQEVMPRPGHQHGVLSITFSPDGKTLASRGGDGTVRLWDVTSRKELRQLSIGTGSFYLGSFNATRPEQGNRSVAFSPDGTRVAALGAPFGDEWEGRAFVWEVQSGRKVGEFRELKVPGLNRIVCYDLEFSPDGEVLAVYSPVGVRLWSLSSKEQRRLLPGSGRGLFEFSPDGRSLALFVPLEGLHLWDWHTGDLLRSFNDRDIGRNGLAFSPGGHLLASPGGGYEAGSYVPLLRLWETASGLDAGLLKGVGGSDGTWSVAFSLDGRLVATGQQDSTIRLWDVVHGKELAKLEGHEGPVRTVAFSPDGKTLASGSEDTTILLWDISGYRPNLPDAPDAKQLPPLWDALKGGDKQVAPYQAVWLLAGGRDKTVAFVGEQLRPAADPDPKRVRQLIADLDDANFDKREAAAADLARLGPLAEAAMRAALKDPPSAEVRRTLNALLEKLRAGPSSADDLRQMRAVLVLDLIGTPDARDLLAKLAGGAPGARLTHDAKLALERLKHRPATSDAPANK